jgi:hypothetical protein
MDTPILAAAAVVVITGVLVTGGRMDLFTRQCAGTATVAAAPVTEVAPMIAKLVYLASTNMTD